MKCLNCGAENKDYLCDKCCNEINLDKIFNEILSFEPEKCQNRVLRDYSKQFDDTYKIRDCIPKILDKFDLSISEYYYCKYYRATRNEKFEETAIKYLEEHKDFNNKTQIVMCDLIYHYLRNDFIKPQKWCNIVEQNDNAYIELYNVSSEFFSMIGDYDKSEAIINKATKLINEKKARFIFSNEENMLKSFEKQKNLLVRYKTKSPYWPTTEERRKLLARIYDEKEIKHPRVELLPEKIPENEFIPIKEIYDYTPNHYVAFWCSDVKTTKNVSCIYQIAGVKINDGKIIEEFQEIIKPWDGIKVKQSVANVTKIPLEVIENANDVDIVIKKFLKFIEDEILVSTDALGTQAKIFTRALRYSGKNEIKNGFLDILDYAADIDSKFDLENNNREFLLKYFEIDEGRDSLEKAIKNFEIFEKLKRE